MSNSGNVFRIQHNRICYGRRKADIESEIVNVLKDRGSPQTLEEIAATLWYIPKAVLERELTNADGIVSPASKKYYCADNLPISKTERNMIKESIRSFFGIRQEMTEIELLDIVLQFCPHLLSEASFLSWKGMEDSLVSLFKDVITIRNNQIVANR